MMKCLWATIIFLSLSVSAKDLKDDVDDWLAGRKIKILKTTVKDYWPDKIEKKEERITLAKIANQKVLIDTNAELAVLLKVPGMNEMGKGRSNGVVVTTFKYLHDGKKLTVLAVFEYNKVLNKRSLSHVTFKTTHSHESKVRYAIVPSQP